MAGLVKSGPRLAPWGRRVPKLTLLTTIISPKDHGFPSTVPKGHLTSNVGAPQISSRVMVVVVALGCLSLGLPLAKLLPNIGLLPHLGRSIVSSSSLFHHTLEVTLPCVFASRFSGSTP